MKYETRFEGGGGDEVVWCGGGVLQISWGSPYTYVKLIPITDDNIILGQF